MLALLVKTLRELSAFDAGASKRDETDEYDDDYDHVPRELDDLRQELSRRLDAMAEGEKARMEAQAKAATSDGA
jgi:N-acetylglutamate synthase/N-acetylornithine aminotransferase